MNNVKDMVLGILKNNSNPIFANLIDMAQKGDAKGVEDFARNMMKEQGRDFDKEMDSFKNMMSQNKK